MNCHGCNTPLDGDSDSEAHIVPNALGGRLSPKGLICRKCNNVLGEIADGPLITAFGPWPTLINMPRDRGENYRAELQTRSNKKIRVEANGSRTQGQLIYEVQPNGDEGFTVRIEAPTMALTKQLLGRAKKEFPQLDIEEALAHAKVVSEIPRDDWKVSTSFGPENVFGGALAAFWLYFLWKERQELMPWSRLLEVINRFKSGHGSFRYFPSGLPGLTGPAISISNRLVIRSVPATGLVVGFLEVLGTLRVGGAIVQGPKGLMVEHVYVSDVMNRADRSNEFRIDPVLFDQTNWSTVGLLASNVEELRRHLQEAQMPLVEEFARRELTLGETGPR